MLPASLAATRPELIATADVRLRERRARRSSRPRSSPRGVARPDVRGSGRASPPVSPPRGNRVDARLGRDRGRREGIVARDHHGLDPHSAELREALLDAALTMSFSSTTTLSASTTTSGAVWRSFVFSRTASGKGASPWPSRASRPRPSRPLRSGRSPMSTPPHAGLRVKGTNTGAELANVALAGKENFSFAG